jgi:hypothetical protein
MTSYDGRFAKHIGCRVKTRLYWSDGIRYAIKNYNQGAFPLLYRLIILMLFIGALMSHCPPLALGQVIRHRAKANTRRPYSVRAKSTKELSRLIENLRAQGAKVRLTNEKVSQPFFSSTGRIININNEAIQVFQYTRAATAEDEAKRVSPDGMSIGTNKPSWMAPPHFFKSGKLIVLYVGNDPTVLKVLQTAIGNQFAGG